MAFETIEIKTDSLFGGQAISIPEKFKFDDNKVYLKKIGNALFIIPFHRPWDSLINSLDAFTPDFMTDRVQQDDQKREPFD